MSCSLFQSSSSPGRRHCNRAFAKIKDTQTNAQLQAILSIQSHFSLKLLGRAQMMLHIHHVQVIWGVQLPQGKKQCKRITAPGECDSDPCLIIDVILSEKCSNLIQHLCVDCRQPSPPAASSLPPIRPRLAKPDESHPESSHHQ